MEWFIVDSGFLLARFRGAEHAQPLRVGGHDVVFDPVMNHLDEVAGAVWAAM
jgi:hypothetical protein